MWINRDTEDASPWSLNLSSRSLIRYVIQSILLPSFLLTSAEYISSSVNEISRKFLPLTHPFLIIIISIMFAYFATRSSSRFTLRFLHGKEDDNFSRHFPPSRSPHNEILPALLLIRESFLPPPPPNPREVGNRQAWILTSAVSVKPRTMN